MNTEKWFRIALINLLILSCIGILLRYKIAFTLEWLDQKHLLHGHSHFAFSGWVSQALMTLIIAALSDQKKAELIPRFQWLLIGNLLASYGMLISFIIEGYGPISITFSTLSIVLSYAFGIVCWRMMNEIKEKRNSHLLFKAAILYNVISSVGAFALAYMMANKIIHQNWYLSSIYFFLHFQYNGWFMMACLGLFSHYLGKMNIHIQNFNRIAWMMILSCIPAYFLSTLWMNIPIWLYLVIVLAAIAQLLAWIMLLKQIKIHYAALKRTFNKPMLLLSGLAGIALSIKLLLQAGSTIPALSTWAFGFRPIVIGYLHLMLLGVITLFIIAYAFQTGAIKLTSWITRGCIVFVIGILLNQLLLMIQGTSAITYSVVPRIDIMLICAALVMFSGLLIMNLGNLAKEDSSFNG